MHTDANLDTPHRGELVLATGGGPPPRPDRGPAIAEYAWVVRRRLWAVGLAAIAGCAASYAISTRLTPIYESVATVELDRDTPAGIVGDQATRASYSPDDDLYMATQMRLIQVDAVIRPVAHRFGLETQKAESGADEAPIRLKDLKVSRVPNTRLLQLRYRSGDRVLAAAVVNAICEGFLENHYTNRLRSVGTMSRYARQELQQLKASLERSSLALARYKQDLNLVNPEKKTTLAAERVIQLNAEYIKVQSERIRREAEYHLAQSESLDSAQASSLGEPLHKLLARRNEMREKFSQTKGHYGVDHPEYRRAAAQLAEIDRQIEEMRQSIARRHDALYGEAVDRERMLGAALKGAKAEADLFNQKEIEYERLKNEAESERRLYEQLSQRVKEADINSSFRNDAIRVVEPGRPPAAPVFPRPKLNMLLAGLLFTVIGSAGAIGYEKIRPTLSNGADAREYFPAAVLGEVPLVHEKSRASGRHFTILDLDASRPDHARLLPGAQPSSATAFIEAVRFVRNTVLLQPASRMRTIVVTSALPREGKTTVAVSMAVLNALRNRRTLLIDGDLRRPFVHRLLDVPNAAGLANFIDGADDWKRHVLRSPALGFLEVLPAGAPGAATIDRAHDRMQELLERAALDYDLVVVDAPPLLGCSETLSLAVAGDGVILVVEANSTRRAQVRASLGALASARANMLGLALNKVLPEDCASTAYSSYYTHASPET